jgi:dephospho-CoA kinase
MTVVVVVVGMPGSGKDTLLRAAKSLGFGHTSMGDVVRRYAMKLNIGESDEAIGGFANSEREKHGPAVWAARTLQNLPPGNVIIDGSRSLREIEYFKSRMGADLKVIAVRAPSELRLRRLQARQRADAPGTLEDFTRREERELAWGLGKALESADIALDNEGTIDEFSTECMATLRKLLEPHGKSI